jgi:hypothetical protein
MWFKLLLETFYNIKNSGILFNWSYFINRNENMSKLITPSKPIFKNFISIEDCQKKNMLSETKECKFIGNCIHQSILILHKKWCLRG